jgi:hypothetical protein
MASLDTISVSTLVVAVLRSSINIYLYIHIYFFVIPCSVRAPKVTFRISLELNCKTDGE